MSILNEYQEVLDELDGIQIQEDSNEKDKELYEYQAFVQHKLRTNPIKSLSEMSYVQKDRFLNECRKLWEEMKAKDMSPKDLKLATGEKPSEPGKGTNSAKKPKKLKEKNIDEIKPGDRLKRWMGIDEGDADDGNTMNENWTNKQRKSVKPKRQVKPQRKITETLESKKIDRKINEIESLLESDRRERNGKKNNNLNEGEVIKNVGDLIGRTVTDISYDNKEWVFNFDDGNTFILNGKNEEFPNAERKNKLFGGKGIKKARYRHSVLTLVADDGTIDRFNK